VITQAIPGPQEVEQDGAEASWLWQLLRLDWHEVSEPLQVASLSLQVVSEPLQVLRLLWHAASWLFQLPSLVARETEGRSVVISTTASATDTIIVFRIIVFRIIVSYCVLLTRGMRGTFIYSVARIAFIDPAAPGSPASRRRSGR
jgi:hypothetical protein